VFLYDGQSNSTSQLTFDATGKEAVFMWQAPELNNAYVFFTVVGTPTSNVVAFYRQMPNSTDWTAFATIHTPSGAPPFVISPEPFVYNGKSYVFMVRSTSSDSTDMTVPTEIWLASMDGTFNQRLSDPSISEVRSDPEYFITDQGPYIYFNRYVPAIKGKKPFAWDGVYVGRPGITAGAAAPTFRAATPMQMTCN
jgi:hypothetical protein